MNYVFNRRGTLLAGIICVYTQPAFAYIDPGTGSMLLQGLLAGIAGAAVVLKLYWYRIKNFFIRKPAEGSATGTQNRGRTTDQSR